MIGRQYMLHGNVCSTQVHYSACSQPINAWFLSLFVIAWYMSGSATVQHNKPWEQQTAVCASAAAVLVRSYYSVPTWSNLWLGVRRDPDLLASPRPLQNTKSASSSSKQFQAFTPPVAASALALADSGGHKRSMASNPHLFRFSVNERDADRSASLSFTEKRRRCWSVVRYRWCMSSGGSSTSSSILKVDLPGIAQHGKYQRFYKDPPQNCGRLGEEKEICTQMESLDPAVLRIFTTCRKAHGIHTPSPTIRNLILQH